MVTEPAEVAALCSARCQAHSISVFLRYLFPCVIRLDFIFPALSSFIGFSPAHETRCAGDWKADMSTPSSAIMAHADGPLIPGIDRNEVDAAMKQPDGLPVNNKDWQKLD